MRSGEPASRRHIGVALSGGGHRATVWALGVLLYLADAGKNREVVTISSVSGGSIANGIVADQLDYGQAAPDLLRQKIRPSLRHVAQDGLFFWGRATNLFVAATLGALVLGTGFVVVWVVAALVAGATHLEPFVHAAGVLGVLLLAAGLSLFSRRSIVVDTALDKVHFGGVRKRLAQVSSSVEHVFCSTELQASDHLYMSPRFLYSYRLGRGDPANLPLSTAVQCSACLPGAFAVRRLPVAPHRFAHPSAKHLVLTDGGVYDNMADQWEVGMPDRLARTDLPTEGAAVDEVVVANSSRGWSWKPMPKSRVYLLGEVLAVLRVKDVQYDVTTSHRRQQLVRRFDQAARSGAGMCGALVQIGQSPYRVVDAYADQTVWPSRRDRALAARLTLDAAGMTHEEWAALADRCASVPTVLRKLGPDATADLLQTSYVLAMTNLHVILGYPLLAVPDRTAFEQLL